MLGNNHNLGHSGLFIGCVGKPCDGSPSRAVWWAPFAGQFDPINIGVRKGVSILGFAALPPTAGRFRLESDRLGARVCG